MPGFHDRQNIKFAVFYGAEMHHLSVYHDAHLHHDGANQHHFMLFIFICQ
ncbi:MAG: hypothetical protein ACD_21C00016G0007 [uncultured bacterium]|nr:MAG: hypothetical protein ACD_21C00016G0007 [uncultured bacterium]